MINTNWAQTVADYMIKIYDRMLTTASGGNISVKDDEGRIWITPGGTDKGIMRAEDIVLVDREGQVIKGGKPSSELAFHKMIYETRSDIRAIIHAHSPGIIAFSAIRKIPQLNTFEASYNVCGSVLMAPYELTGTKELGENIAACFGNGADSVVLENHGVVSAAASIEDTFNQFLALEITAQIQINAARLGDIKIYNSLIRSNAKHIKSIEISDELLSFYNRGIKRGLLSEVFGLISCNKGNEYIGCNSHKKLHMAIYNKHMHFNAVISAMPPALMAFAISNERYNTRLIPESYMVLQDVGTFEYEDVINNVEDFANSITRLDTIIIVKNYGVIALGENLTQAFDRLEVAEFSARALLDASSIGKPVKISDQEIDRLKCRFHIR